MIFLYPLHLFALVLAAIPPLIHLFSRRKLQRLPFSSLEFLKAVEKTRMRWWRLREILLLVLRTLALLLVALALARPVLRHVSLPGIGLPPPSSLAVILDNSFSMGRKLEGEGDLFEAGKRIARKLIEELSRGDEVQLILSSDRAEIPLDQPTRDSELVGRAVENARLSFLPTDHFPALRASQSYLRGAKGVRKAIYLITDLQRLGFESLVGESLSLGPELDLQVVEVSGGRPGNMSVESVEMAEKLAIPEEVVELRAEVRNYGAGPERTPVSLWVDGVKRGQSEVRLGAGGVASLSFSYRLDSLGDQSGFVEIEDPSLEVDNTRFFSLHIPPRVDVLLVDGGDLSRPEWSGSYYLAKALDPGGDLHTRFHPEPVAWSQLAGRDLRKYEVVALLNGRDFGAEVGERLRKFVEGGGGLLVALGDRVNPSSYRELLQRLFDVALGEPPTGKIDPSKFVTASQADYSSPVLASFRDPSKGDITLPRFYMAYPLRGGRRVLVRLPDFSPLLVDGGIGSGRAVLSAVPLDRSWSDLPIRAIYLPLVHRLFSYLVKEVGIERALLVGEEYSLELEGSPRSCSLIRPEGRQVAVEPVIGVGSVSVTLKDLDSPGVYRVLGDGQEVASLAVNLDPAESDPSAISEEELKALLPEARLVRGWGPLSPMTRSSSGSELRRPFLLLALFLLVGEMVLSLRRS